LSVEEVKERIQVIGNEIENKLSRVVCYENAPTGRKGKRCYLSTGKKGITLAVIGYVSAYRGYHFLIAFEVGDAVLREGMAGSVDEELRKAVLDYQKNEDQSVDRFLGKDDKKFQNRNPKICPYTIENFEKLWGLLLEKDLGLQDSEPRGKKLFQSNEFDAKKIVARYRYAIEQEDQVLLGLGRRLLEADDWDHFISINMKETGYAEREHIVPCYMIHWKIIDLLYPEGPNGKRTLRKNDVDEEVARMIERNLKIVHISKQQRWELDINRGWRTTMPEGWGWEQSPYARLISAEIPVRKVHEKYRDSLQEEFEGRKLNLEDDTSGAGE